MAVAGMGRARSGRWVRRGSSIYVLGLGGGGGPDGLDGLDELEESFAGELEALEDEELEVGRPTLRRGSRGTAVRELQGLLKTAGFDPGPIDGIFGSRTAAAVIGFQRARRLTVDGIVGPQTWGALAESAPAGPSAPAAPSAPATSADHWTLPADVRAAGEAQLVRYDDAPAWDGGRNCTVPGNCDGTAGLTAGAAELSRHIRAGFPGVSSIGGYCCRQNTAAANKTSVHGVGRALDIMIPPLDRYRANSSVGDPIANWLVRNAAAIGVQYIIWNRTQWSGHKSAPKDRAYTGPVPHTDHIHAEVNTDGANRRTPWFAGRGA
jgi:hypothetical protein